jgi:hypothetical protein
MEILFEHPWWTTIWIFLIFGFLSDGMKGKKSKE